MERSWNGEQFETIGLVRPQGEAGAPGQYRFIDKDYYTSVVYYRLRRVDHALQSTLAGQLACIQLAEDFKEFVITPLSGLPGSLYADGSRLPAGNIIVDAVDAALGRARGARVAT